MKNRENISKKSGLSYNNLNSSSNNKEYNSIPSNRFYTAQEEITIRLFFTIEKYPIFQSKSTPLTKKNNAFTTSLQLNFPSVLTLPF